MYYIQDPESAPLVMRSAQPVGGFDADLPFELRVLEAALDCCSQCLGWEVAAVEAHAWPLLDHLAKHVRSAPFPPR